MIRYKKTETGQELKEILLLQEQNHMGNITDAEKQQEGFVTVRHTLELLEKMHLSCPHTIAINEAGEVVGYALSMTKDFSNNIEVLKPMFQQIDQLVSTNANYIVMGQVCIAKNYRKQGVFKGLYNHMKIFLESQFDMVITEVDEANTRSMQAHEAVGFTSLKKFSSGGQDWNLIVWRWK